MKTIVMILVIALCLFGAASPAHAQYYPSYSYYYNVYPGGGSYNYSVSNGYETISMYQSASYGSGYYSYNYSSPYGSYYWYRNVSYPVNYYYPAYNYQYPYLYQSRVQYPIRIR